MFGWIALQTDGSATQAEPAETRSPVADQVTPAANDLPNDFDFYAGTWKVHNRRLKLRWVNSLEWDEFPATEVVTRVLDGLGHIDEITFPTKGFAGLTVSLFDRAKQEWSFYWVNSGEGVLFPPVVGRFENGRGVFYGNDMDGNKPVRVRFIWSDMTANSAHWEQAFSVDGGVNWETNWTMDFTRVGP